MSSIKKRSKKSFSLENFHTFIKEHGVLGFFDEPITLKSGQLSTWYVNWRSVSNDAYLLEELAEFVIQFVEDNEIPVNTFYVLPEGASKLGIITQFLWAKAADTYAKGSDRLAMGRAKPKEHGAPADRFFIGEPVGKVIILEDVTTTGGSLLRTVDMLKEQGVDISAALCLTERANPEEHDALIQAMQDRGVKYEALSYAKDLI